MKFTFKGIENCNEDLPESQLPLNAVQLKRSKNIVINMLCGLVSIAFNTMIFVLVIKAIAIIKKVEIIDFFNTEGLGLAIVYIYIHEIIQGLCYGKNSRVSIYLRYRHLYPFIWSGDPISKKRYIWMKIAPTILFGIIPAILWIVLPESSELGRIMIGLASFTIL